MNICKMTPQETKVTSYKNDRTPWTSVEKNTKKTHQGT